MKKVLKIESHDVQKDKEAKDHHWVQEDKDAKDHHQVQKDKDAMDHHRVQKDKDAKAHRRVQEDKDGKHHRRVQKSKGGDEHKENIKNKLEKNLSDPNVNKEMNSTRKKFLSDFLSWLWTFIFRKDFVSSISVLILLIAHWRNILKNVLPKKSLFIISHY